jgi:small basic protein (TIGR04137 family)
VGQVFNLPIGEGKLETCPLVVKVGPKISVSSGAIMSIDKSLRRKNSLERSRNVLKRDERIKVLINDERWKDGQSPFGLPKVRVMKIAKKPKKAAKEEEKPAEEGAATAAPAAEKKAEKK